MTLNKQAGNMYEFVTHTYNVVKGKCLHDCSYCYMKKFKLNDIRFDDKSIKIPLGKNNFIFVGSSTDMFADDVKHEWILRVLEHCNKFDNTYLFQSKNVKRMLKYKHLFPPKCIVGTTIETNRIYKNIMGNTIPPIERARCLQHFKLTSLDENNSRKDFINMVTIEPILDFDLDELVDIIRTSNADWVNIGSDSKGHDLPEPSNEKIKTLILELSKFTTVLNKQNLMRIFRD